MGLQAFSCCHLQCKENPGDKVRDKVVFSLSGQGQTSNFTCAEPYGNEQKLLFLLIFIRFHTCKVRHLTLASTNILEHLRTCVGGIICFYLASLLLF